MRSAGLAAMFFFLSVGMKIYVRLSNIKLGDPEWICRWVQRLLHPPGTEFLAALPHMHSEKSMAARQSD